MACPADAEGDAQRQEPRAREQQLASVRRDPRADEQRQHPEPGKGHQGPRLPEMRPRPDRQDQSVGEVRQPAAADNRVGADQEREQPGVQRQRRAPHAAQIASRASGAPVSPPARAAGANTSARNVSVPPASDHAEELKPREQLGRNRHASPGRRCRRQRIHPHSEGERALGHVSVVAGDHPPAHRVAGPSARPQCDDHHTPRHTRRAGNVLAARCDHGRRARTAGRRPRRTPG